MHKIHAEKLNKKHFIGHKRLCIQHIKLCLCLSVQQWEDQIITIKNKHINFVHYVFYN